MAVDTHTLATPSVFVDRVGRAVQLPSYNTLAAADANATAVFPYVTRVLAGDRPVTFAVGRYLLLFDDTSSLGTTYVRAPMHVG